MTYPEPGRAAPAKCRVRPTKFTPERIQQIKELIARGVSCEEIAAVVGVTVGTLKVTCSRLGISLRRPRPRIGNGQLPLRAAIRVTGPNTARFTITVRHHGEERHTEVPLTPAMIGQLALEATSRGLSISEFARDLVLDVARKRLVHRVLEADQPAREGPGPTPSSGDEPAIHGPRGEADLGN